MSWLDSLRISDTNYYDNTTTPPTFKGKGDGYEIRGMSWDGPGDNVVKVNFAIKDTKNSSGQFTDIILPKGEMFYWYVPRKATDNDKIKTGIELNSVGAIYVSLLYEGNSTLAVSASTAPIYNKRIFNQI